MHYLQLSHIQICQEAVEWKDALITSCQPLLDNGSITQEYIDAILYDQKERHLYMFLSEGLVLAHSSIDKGVNDIDVALTTFKEPVLFNNGRQAQIIIGMCATDQTKHIHILNDIIEIFSKKKFLEKLANMNTTAEIYQYSTSSRIKKAHRINFMHELFYFYYNKPIAEAAIDKTIIPTIRTIGLTCFFFKSQKQSIVS